MAFTAYRPLDFSGIDSTFNELAKSQKEKRDTEALLKQYDVSRGIGSPAQDPPSSPLAALGQGISNLFSPSKAPLAALGQQQPDAAPKAQQANFDPGKLGDVFAAKEAQYDLPPGYLRQTAAVESGGNPNAKNPNSSAGGLFQFVDGTAKQYGLGDKFDPIASTDAAARLASDNKAALTNALGRVPTAGELYLAHQQGAQGAIKLLSNPNAPAEAVVGSEAARLNGGAGLTAGQFAQKWTGKVDGAGQPVQVAQAPAQAGSSMADVPAPGAAQAQGFAIPGGQAQPATQQNVKGDMIRTLLANPSTRDVGKKLWEQALTGKQYGFQVIGDQLYRTNPNSGQAELVPGVTNPNAEATRRLTEVNIKKGERDLEGKGFRSLITPEERAQYGVPQNYTGAVQVDGDNQLHFPGKASTEVNVKNEGTIPGGYQVERDPQGNPVRMVPIPGSPAAKEIEDAGRTTDLTKAQTQQTGNVVIDALNDVDRLMKEATLPTTGALGSRVADMKGTAAHDIKNALGTIGANISFQTLAQMRAASPTGGALGAVSDSEQRMLQNAWGALEQSQSEGQFKANLGRVRAIFERVVHGRTLTSQERLSGGPMTMDRAKSLRDEAAAAIASGAPKEEVAKRLKEKYGITPEGL